jgi:hypothetical protein
MSGPGYTRDDSPYGKNILYIEYSGDLPQNNLTEEEARQLAEDARAAESEP